jgi:hypothetical protein
MRMLRSSLALVLASTGLVASCGDETTLTDSGARSERDAARRDTGVEERDGASARDAGRIDRPTDRVPFGERCEAPGVVRCIGFDATSDIEGHVFAAGDGVERAEIATDVRSSGDGSLRFTVPGTSGSDGAGSFWTNFSDDLSVQFGEGEEFFVQWRQRFSPEMIRTFRTTDGQMYGWKQIIVGEGDQPGMPTVYSCTELELVFNAIGLRPGDETYVGPGFYHSCGRFVGLDFYDGTQVRMQHQGPPYCYYPDDPDGGCFRFVADEWMTFQLHVQIGTWNTESSRTRVYAAREGEPSVLVFDSVESHPDGFVLYNNPGSGSGTLPGARYGKLWLLPYITRRDESIAHETGQTWYDELVISREPIADPS